MKTPDALPKVALCEITGLTVLALLFGWPIVPAVLLLQIATLILARELE